MSSPLFLEKISFCSSSPSETDIASQSYAPNTPLTWALTPLSIAKTYYGQLSSGQKPYGPLACLMGSRRKFSLKGPIWGYEDEIFVSVKEAIFPSYKGV